MLFLHLLHIMFLDQVACFLHFGIIWTDLEMDSRDVLSFKWIVIVRETLVGFLVSSRTLITVNSSSLKDF